MRSGIEIRIDSGSEIERGQLGNPLTSTSSSERKAGPRAGSTIRRFGIENRIEIMRNYNLLYDIKSNKKRSRVSKVKATSGIMNAAHIHGELYLRIQRTSTHKSEDLSLSTVRLSRQLSSRSPDQSDVQVTIVDAPFGSLVAIASACLFLSDSSNTAIAIYLRREVSVDPRLDKHNSFKKWLDVLVNNAGVGARTTIEKADMETFDRVFRLNVRGVYDLTRRLVPALVATKGSIVNVSSISGHMVNQTNMRAPIAPMDTRDPNSRPGKSKGGDRISNGGKVGKKTSTLTTSQTREHRPPARHRARTPNVDRYTYYCLRSRLPVCPTRTDPSSTLVKRLVICIRALLAALDHFTKLIALELAPKGVRVNAVSPGITVSEFVKRLTGYNDEQYMAWLQESEKSIPMRRVAQGEHIAQAIAFLASDAAELITGVILPVDGAFQLAGVGNSDVLKKQIKE
ncbi:3-oxoacyl-[acyl-carrier-protein] reductase FabG [Eumeta japonica]|uniref:3-oxoacyl-[acyl-carrier-protein] reductase FabG n=1 Tax=Eumeta variegata TaxID=151549 RepID=A0A4C1Z0A4_EUMVA|nr:3-oxoacyl-[acyl-carrier-protein] reductase FabG [Eumeta japonica]